MSSFPKVVWVADPGFADRCHIELWFVQQSTGRFVKGKLENKPTLSEQSISMKLAEGFALAELAEIFPPPKGYSKKLNQTTYSQGESDAAVQ